MNDAKNSLRQLSNVDKKTPVIALAERPRKKWKVSGVSFLLDDFQEMKRYCHAVDLGFSKYIRFLAAQDRPNRQRKLRSLKK